jgi:hypothetical protein
MARHSGPSFARALCENTGIAAVMAANEIIARKTTGVFRLLSDIGKSYLPDAGCKATCAPLVRKGGAALTDDL